LKGEKHAKSSQQRTGEEREGGRERQRDREGERERDQAASVKVIEPAQFRVFLQNKHVILGLRGDLRDLILQLGVGTEPGKGRAMPGHTRVFSQYT
jgi:hypothetical protein